MTHDAGSSPALVLGPLLRYVGDTAATIWTETDRACEVEILGHRARTFEVDGHHYALVVITGLQPGSEHEYQVALDGTVCWPEPDSPFPPSRLRTTDPARPLRLAFGSCRVAQLRLPPRSQRRRTRHEQHHGADALTSYALDLLDAPDERWPDAMLLIGDQVYADETGPATQQFIRERRDPAQPPGYEVADFAEYCFLYKEAWSEPTMRWVLSVLPTAMIFDDHDVHDDWNTSAAWRRDYQAKPWWRARITGAYMSYWVYQHIGNLSPEDLAEDELWRKVSSGGGDARALLADFAVRADRSPDGIQWTYRRTYGRVRVIVIDSRSGRVLEENGQRLMVDPAEWAWITGSAAGDWDHVVLASTLPLLLPRGIHYLEAWNEAVCDGAWGRRFARTGEQIRRAADLEHWPAFGTSFADFEQLLAGLARGEHGTAPASVCVLGGDVHNSYLARVSFPAGPAARSAVYQAVCSPFHNLLEPSSRRLQRLTGSVAGQLLTGALARLAGVRKPALGWQVTEGPWFANMLAVLDYDRRQARIRFARTTADMTRAPRLQTLADTRLS